MLDPRISYDGMRVDYANDDTLAEHLENSKSALFEYFHKNYASKVTSSSGDTTPSSTSSSSHVASPSLSPPSTFGSVKKSFTAQYHRKDKPAVNELEEYFKLPLEDFDLCDPIRWWVSRQAQFPNLYRLACDVLSIPGE